jgi:serine/threonine protein kinase
VWSLGVFLFYIVYGQLPFGGDTAEAVATAGLGLWLKP